MWRMQYHEELRFEFKHKALDYRDRNGLAWSHQLLWDWRGWRLFPHFERLNAWQRKHYKVHQ